MTRKKRMKDCHEKTKMRFEISCKAGGGGAERLLSPAPPSPSSPPALWPYLKSTEL